MPFLTQGKTNWKFLLIVIVLVVIAGGGICFLSIPKTSGPMLSGEKQNEEIKVSEEIIEEEFAISVIDLQDALENLKTSMTSNETEKVGEGVRQYQQAYSSFQSLASSLDSEKDPFAVEVIILKVRLALWDNYHKFLEIMESAEAESLDAVLLEEARENWEKDLRSYMITANGKTFIDLKEEKNSSFDPVSFLKNWISQSFFIRAQSDIPTVIHKKVYYDFVSPGEQGERIVWCWRYEGWVDIEQRSGRWEMSIPIPAPPYPTGQVCRREVNIYDEKIGKDLMLDLDRKYAEWIHDKPDKHGLGGIQAGKSLDPLAVFSEKIETGEYVLEGTEIVEGQEVYVVRYPIWDGQAYDPERQIITRSKEYQIIYIAAHSYLPVRKMQYYELLIKENEADEEGYWKVTLTHNTIIEAEMIYFEELPENFFLPEIPEGYEMRDFSAKG